MKEITESDQFGAEGEVPEEISLSDVALMIGPQAALCCSQALDWKDGDLRKLMIGVVSRWMRRGYKLMDDVKLIETIDALCEWATHKTSVDLNRRSYELLAEIVLMPADVSPTSDEMAIMQTWTLVEAASFEDLEAARWTNYGAASVVLVGSQLITAAKDDPEELRRQILDLIEAFS